MDTTLNALVINILVLAAPVLAGMVGKLILNKIGTEKVKKIQAEIATKSELTAAAVNFAEQAYQELDGAGKYAKALEWLSNQAVKVGLKLTTDEAKGLIEAAVLALKKAVV